MDGDGDGDVICVRKPPRSDRDYWLRPNICKRPRCILQIDPILDSDPNIYINILTIFHKTSKQDRD